MKVLFAPSIPWISTHKKFVVGTGPDNMLLFKILNSCGIECFFADPSGKIFNPFFRNNAFLQSIDPIRACKICLIHRDIDVVVSVFEGAATSLSAIRGLLNSRTAIAMWDIGLTNWKIRNQVINFTLPRIDKLMVLGSNQVEYINKNYSPCKSISVIGHYVDTTFFSLQAPIERGYVLSVGEDVGRDFPSLIAAAPFIEREIVIKASKFELDQLVPNVSIKRQRLNFLDFRELYRDSCVVVVPSHHTENASGVSTILEAYACGRPLVVTDNPGIGDFIIQNKTCLVVPKNDPRALAEAVNFLMNNPTEANRLVENGRAFVEKFCSVESFARRFATELSSIMQEKAL